MQCTVRAPRLASQSDTGAERRPAETTRRGQGGRNSARAAGASPSSDGHASGSAAAAPHSSGTVRKGAPRRSAMPSACAAVPARGSASTQIGASASPVVMDGAAARGYEGATDAARGNQPWPPLNTPPTGTATPR